ncbi:MAG TPA: MFS transporter [Chitinophagales bacterium]|nr:MFS transporter [Chitinophagales bacterium]HNC64980.1 MFS transporter [Chitinophagales bacterium]
MSMPNSNNKNATMLVIVAALGYFVDVFDLLLFGMVRIGSLRDLGVPEADLESVGMHLDNLQMIGMLLGGLIWGIIGDKKGRLSVLFGSILTYSIANFLNAHINSVEQYAVLRLIAGFGLAGELGAGITLINETLSKEKRGLAAAFVAGFGVLGAVFGALLVLEIGDWRMCYMIGGGMGVALLILRISVFESGMYQNVKHKTSQLGDLRLLFGNKKNLKKYLAIIFIAVPIWYVVQLYSKYAPELAEALGLHVENKKEVAVYAIMAIYTGLTFGDVACGFYSNWVKSRKKAIITYLSFLVGLIVIFWFVAKISFAVFYGMIFLMGLGIGYWAVFVTTASEAFGTNIRSTVSNTVPNFVRGFVVIINFMYISFKDMTSSTITANILTGIICVGLALYAWTQLEETYGKDLDYVEE